MQSETVVEEREENEVAEREEENAIEAEAEAGTGTEADAEAHATTKPRAKEISIEVIKKVSYPLLNRDELFASASRASNAQAKQALADKLNVNPELVVVKRIVQKFGSQETQIIAYVYKDEETFKKLEEIRKKKKVPEAASGEAAPAEKGKGEKKAKKEKEAE